MPMVLATGIDWARGWIGIIDASFAAITNAVALSSFAIFRTFRELQDSRTDALR